MYKRPWGYFDVLIDSFDYKVKRLVIFPEKKISLQFHKLRNEHWFIVSGEGIVTIANSEKNICTGESIDISSMTEHCVENISKENLVIVEIQTGFYFGEDDIVRIDKSKERMIYGSGRP